MSHYRRVPLVMLGLTLAFAMPSAAQQAGGDLQQSAYQQTLAQETVRKQADKIQAQLAALIDALKLNGLDPAQLSTLTNASAHLSSLNQEEMQKIINSLQSASIASDDPKRQDALVTAYQGQKDLVIKLKQLSAQIAAQQISDGLVAQLENLIARQTGNLRHTSDLAAAGTASDDRQQNSQKLVASEQAAIGGEIDLLFNTLPAAAPASAPGTAAPASDSGTMAKAVLDAANGTTLKADAADASALTASNTFGGAVGKETSVREGLVTLLHAALANQDATTRLEQAKTQLDQVVEDQKAVADATKDGKLDAAALADRQAQINDRAEVAKALLKPLQPAAADQVKAAQDAIKVSSDALANGKKPDDAVAKQQDVAKALAAAQDMLAKQMAAVAAQQSQSPVDKTAQIEKAQAEIKEAQALAQTDPKTAAQAAAAAQKDALAASTDAADKAGQAADDLQKPQPDAAAANQALTQANDDLQKQKDDLAQATKDFQALAAASQQLAQAQQSAASADQAMQDASSNLTQAAHDMTQAQNAVSQTQAQAQQSGAPADAQQALAQAADALKGATSQAVQAKAADAKAQNGKAMDAMKKAQDSLGKAMAAASAKGAPGSKGAPGAGQPGSAGGPPGLAQGQGGGGMAAGTVGNESPDGFEIGGGGGGTLKGVGASSGVANVVGALTPKDRDAISQYQGEKTAPEYQPMVQQYLKNLADSTDGQ